MTRHVVFACDGAPVPRRIEGPARPNVRRINSGDPSDDLTLRAEPVGDTLLGEVPARVADLVHIAALAYAADQEVSRGGGRDVYGDDWRRRLTLVIPVAEPDFWGQDAVRAGLSDVLQYLTDDEWEFVFRPFRPGGDVQTRFGIADSDRPPEAVMLLSGGADSLCAALEAATVRGWRPLLVSHRPTTYLNSRQRAVARGLAERLGCAMLPHVSFLIHRRGSDASDTSQRSRGFLFASLGVAAASERGSPEVHLADNGVVSLNLPITRQLLGAMASRATHPKFISRFNRLIQFVLPGGPRLVNPLWDRTRAETLGILKRAGAETLLRETRSCSRLRGRTADRPQCGGCYQCVDRRFAVIAAELEDEDPASKYELDIFTHSLPEGDPRATAVSYVQFAEQVAQLSVDEIFAKFSELPDCVLPDDPRSGETGLALAEMLQRHARSTLDALGAMVKHHSEQLVSRSLRHALPDKCLLRLAIDGFDLAVPDPAPVRNRFFAEHGVRHILYEGVQTAMVDNQALRYLEHLLRALGREFTARELYAVSHGQADHPPIPFDWEEAGLREGEGSLQTLITTGTFEDIKRHLDGLKQEQAEAEEARNQAAALKLEDAREQLMLYLKRARGRGGRLRAFRSNDERAPSTVSAGLSRARGHPQRPPRAR